MKAVFSGLALVLSLSFPAFATDYRVVNVCAEYTNTGKKYEVEAQVVSGAELNRRTQSYDYETYTTYVVIFWAENQVSIIGLDFGGGPSLLGSDGVDQQGYPWNVSTGTTFCY
jgi:hypothetical protein